MNYDKRPDPALIIILLVTLFLHVQLLFNDFHTDDFQILMIMEDGFSWQDFMHMENMANFRPFANAAIFIRSLILDNIPALWYLLNIILHLWIVYLLYAIIHRKADKAAAIIGSLFFAVYFQHFEAVLWLYGIVRLLAALMIVLAIRYLIDYRQTGNKFELIKSCLFYMVSLFTVEDTLIFSPFFCLVLFIAKKDRSRSFDANAFIYILVAACYLLLRFPAIGWSDPSTAYFQWGLHLFGNYLDYCGWLLLPDLNHPYIYPFIARYAPFILPFAVILKAFSQAAFGGLIIFIILRGNKFERFSLAFVLISLIMPSLLLAKVSTKLIYIPSLGMAAIWGSFFSRINKRPGGTKLKAIRVGIILYFIIQALAVNLTIYYYRVTQRQVSQIVDNLENLNINWPDYEYLILDNLPGRARPGHAIKYRLKIDKRLLINNRETEDLPDLTGARAELRAQNKGYIVVDFRKMPPQIIDRYKPTEKSD